MHGDINWPPNPASRWFLVKCPPNHLIMNPFRWWRESHSQVKCLQAGETNPSWCSGTSIKQICSFLKIKWMWRVLSPQNVSEAQVLVRRPIAHARAPSPSPPRVALVQIRSSQWMWVKSFRGSAHRVVNYYLSRWAWDQCRRGTGANGTHTRNDTCKAGKRLTEEMVINNLSLVSMSSRCVDSSRKSSRVVIQESSSQFYPIKEHSYSENDGVSIAYKAPRKKTADLTLVPTSVGKLSYSVCSCFVRRHLWPWSHLHSCDDDVSPSIYVEWFVRIHELWIWTSIGH